MKCKLSVAIFFLSILLFMLTTSAFGQSKAQYIRIAKIVVDSSQIEKYKAALAIHAKAAVDKEAGVLMLYAVYDKKIPTHITVFEIYASMESYQSHIKTPHFLKYKDTVKDMVKSLELVDVAPIALEAKH